MKIKLNVILSDAQSNILTTLQHTGISYPTSSIVHQLEIEVPDPPQQFQIDRIDIAGDK